MFGKNPVAPLVREDTGTLHVVAGSPFYTIQGEGPFTGRPAVFVRLHGCHLRCTFCDTEFSGEADPVWEVEALAGAIKALYPPRHSRKPVVVITGGEPARQPLERLIRLLVEEDGTGPIIQIETSGSFWQDVFTMPDLFLVVSPKTPYVHPGVARLAYAWKYVVKATDNFSPDDGLPLTVSQPNGDPRPLYRPVNPIRDRVYLSPCDEQDPEKNKANKQMVAKLCMEYGYQAAVQLHKELHVP